MIERLNFYDLYGYLLPGVAVIAVFYGPFWLVGSPHPTWEWSSAVAALVVAYLLGHVLQILARTAFGEVPRPSDTLITGPNAFPEKLTTSLTTLAVEDFGLDLTRASERQIAFESFRAAIQSKELPSYAEQHQGMYALTRGLAAASVLGAANTLGWTLVAVARAHGGKDHFAVYSVMLVLGLVAVVESHRRRTPAWFLVAAAAALWCGSMEAIRHVASMSIQIFVAVVVGLSVTASMFVASFRFFQREFARNVYLTYFARRHSPLTRNAKAKA